MTTEVRTVDVAPGPAIEPEADVTSIAVRPVFAIAAAVTVVLIALSSVYGYHRDELYYLWGGEHLDWGYVDHPPLVPLLARAVDGLGGHTLVALRLVPALIAGWLVVAGALFARELGGSRRAQVLAALAVACTPALHGPEALYGTTAADAAVWAVVLVLGARLLRTGRPQLWVWIGLTVGVGFETKWSIGLLLAGFVVGLLVTPQRTLLWSWWAVAGGVLALGLWMPNLVWNATHEWAFLEFQRRVAEKNGGLDKRLLFFPTLVLLAGITPIIVWLPGWRSLLRRSSSFRAIGVACVVMTAAVFIGAGKPYYVAPMFIALFAAGALVLDRSSRRRRTVTVWVLAITAIVTLPMTVGVLPPSALDAVRPINPELAEMVGWPDLVRETRQAFDSLPPDERARTAIVTSNYANGGALLRDAPDLPVFSAQNSLWHAGPPPASATTWLSVGYPARVLGRWCGSIQQVGVVANSAGVHNEEAGRPILACRSLKLPWPELWTELKHFE